MEQGAGVIVKALSVVPRMNALPVFESEADVRILHHLKTVGLQQVDTKTLHSILSLFLLLLTSH